MNNKIKSYVISDICRVTFTNGVVEVFEDVEDVYWGPTSLNIYVTNGDLMMYRSDKIHSVSLLTIEDELEEEVEEDYNV